MHSEINWHEEWQKHALGFKDGVAHIVFKKLKIPCDKTLLLTPGAGFGDMSHPTTRLALVLMQPHVAGKKVLDIGSGSGILSLAAAHFGAQKVTGIDIDLDAIEHAKENAKLNHLDSLCHFDTSFHDSCDIIVMNMIRLEQKAAYKPYPGCRMAITSGILKEEKNRYLEQTAAWGWVLEEEKALKGWLGFRFTINNPGI